MEFIYNIFGLKRSGKDTLADMLKAEFGTRHLAFADPLRKVVNSAYPFLDMQLLTGNDKEEPILTLPINHHAKNCYPELLMGHTHWSPRLLLQFMGTDIFRDFVSDTTWVDTMKHHLLDINLATVITDCRFPNEYELLKSDSLKDLYKVVNILVERPGFEPKDLHASEQHVKNFEYDVKIVNDGSLAELQYKLLDSILKIELHK